jgi:outer membrane protein
MFMTKKRFAILSLTGMLSFGSVAFGEEVKIGTVDMQKALQGVEAGKAAKSSLEKDFNAKKKELETEKAAFDKATEEFRKQSLVMNEEARAKKQGELQDRWMKFQERTAKSQQEIQEKEQKLTLPIINKLKTIINDVAKQKGYTIVLEKNENTGLFSHEKDDLTGEVITQFNKNKS